MATLTVRVDDDTRDALQEKAQNEGLTLSDLIRGLLLEAVVPVREDEGYVDGYSPDSLDPKDRQMFSLLHRILARVLPDDARDVDGDAEYQIGVLRDPGRALAARLRPSDGHPRYVQDNR
jgi:hypothetical protein